MFRGISGLQFGDSFLSVIRLKTTDIIIYCGTAEEGKSTLMKHHAREIMGKRMIWDYNHEHSFMGVVVHFPEDIEDAFKRGLHHVVFQPFNKSPDAFRQFMRECNRLSQFYNFVLIIDELEVYAEPPNCNLYKKQPDLADLSDTGRHRGIGVWAICSNIGKLSKKIPSRASHIFAFRQHLPSDVEYLVEWIGSKAYMLSPAKAEKKDMKYLEKYHYLHFNKVETVVREPIKG